MAPFPGTSELPSQIKFHITFIPGTAKVMHTIAVATQGRRLAASSRECLCGISVHIYAEEVTIVCNYVLLAQIVYYTV